MANTTINFVWEGKDKKGQLLKGTMRAQSKREVSDKLKRQGIVANNVSKSSRQRSRSGVNEQDVLSFTQQLHTMFNAGVSIVQALEMIEQGSEKEAMATIIAKIRSEVSAGTSLSAALRRFPKHFNSLYCNLIEAGERSGMLDSLLIKISDYMEKSIKLRARLKSAMVYPLSILIVAAVVVTVLMIWVIPSFQDIFRGMGAQLPALTEAVISLSKLMVAHGVKALVVIVVIGVLVHRSYKKSQTFQRAVTRFMMKMPLFGVLMRSSVVSQFSETLAIMLQAGVPMVNAIEFSGRSSGNLIFSDMAISMVQQIKMGSVLSTAMQTTGFFTDMVIQLIRIAEESGRLEEMLNRVGVIFAEKVDKIVSVMSSLMEPAVIVIIGGMVGIVIAAMYLPIFSMGAAAG